MSVPPPDLLGLIHLRAEGRREEDGTIIVETASGYPVMPRCCLLQDARKLGTKRIRVRDFPIQAKPVWIEVRRQRFDCRQCGTVFYEDIPELDTERRLTERFREHLEQQSVALTFSDAARVNGVHETLIRRVFAAYADRVLQNYTVQLPRVLGIDEKHVLGANRLVIGDVENRAMLDMHDSREVSSMNDYFDRALGHERVEVVCQDMWTGYRTLTKRQFPKAVTVIDKYHVQRLANFGVEVVRKALYLGLDVKARRALKRKKHMFLARWERSSPETQARLAKLFVEFPALATAYTLKEQFYDLYECQTRSAAEAYLTRWMADVPPEMERPFKEVRTAVGNWRPHILRYFEHRFTSAYIERLNGSIATLNRNAAGLSFPVLRAKALLKFGKLQALDEIRAYCRMSMSEEDAQEVFSTTVGHGMDLSTLEAAFEQGFV